MKVRPPYWFLLIALVPLTAVICAVLLAYLANREIQEKNYPSERTDSFKEINADTLRITSFGAQVIEDWKKENSWLFKEYASEYTLKTIMLSSGINHNYQEQGFIVKNGNNIKIPKGMSISDVQITSYPDSFPEITNDQMYHAIERIESLEKRVKELKEAQ